MCPEGVYEALGPACGLALGSSVIVDAARSTGPSASLDLGWTWLCTFSNPTWIRILKENWKVLFKVDAHIKFHMIPLSNLDQHPFQEDPRQDLICNEFLAQIYKLYAKRGAT